MELFNLTFQNGLVVFATKIFFLAASFLFTIFLLVVFKQILSLSTLINDENDSVVLKTFAFILLIASVSLFLTALVIL